MQAKSDSEEDDGEAGCDAVTVSLSTTAVSLSLISLSLLYSLCPIYLYTGMRRGGRGYYALDVSDRSAPKYLWQINGGSGDYVKLGQTWSKMIPATVNFKGNKTKVLFFGGGYDPAEDGYSTRTDHTMGNAIYMADAATGKLLWSASNSGADLSLSDMRSSIVANIVAIDSNQDGLTNLLYTADVGGRVWRIDLDNTSTSAGSFAKGGTIADFNTGSSAGISASLIPLMSPIPNMAASALRGNFKSAWGLATGHTLLIHGLKIGSISSMILMYFQSLSHIQRSMKVKWPMAITS